MPVALVTGASSGIGHTFAKTLAARGYDIVAVARDKKRLDTLAEDISAQHGRAVDVLPADLTDAGELAVVEERLAHGAPVDLLVNNAGFGARTRFADHDPDAIEAVITLNVVALTRLTRAALPAMLARRSGAIVHVSSFASFQAAPTWAVYTATKAYVTSFSESLHEEVRGSGVRVLALCPGMTATEFHERSAFDPSRVPKMAWSTAEAVVEIALRDLERGRAISVPGLSNKAAVALSHLLPRALARRTAATVAKRL